MIDIKAQVWTALPRGGLERTGVQDGRIFAFKDAAKKAHCFARTDHEVECQAGRYEGDLLATSIAAVANHDIASQARSDSIERRKCRWPEMFVTPPRFGRCPKAAPHIRWSR